MDATLLCRTATSELFVAGDGSIVKRSGVLAPPGNALGRREVDFYRYVRRRSGAALPVAACYSADYDGDGGRLVLERLATAEHAAVSRHDALVLAVDALAAIHAAFWGRAPLPWSAALPLAGAGVPNAAELRARLERACWQTPAGDVIDSPVVALLARPAHRTLTHADPHLGNVVFRRRGDALEAALIDWQLYEAGIGACDLAYLLVFGMEPAERRAVEDVLVQRYHAALAAAGVRAYAFDACVRDYRLGLARCVLVLIALAEHGALTSDHAERALAPHRDVTVRHASLRATYRSRGGPSVSI